MLTLKVFGKTYQVSDYREASTAYDNARVAALRSGKRKVQDGKIYCGNHHVANVSQNGKVWDTSDWFMGKVPLYAPAP